MTFLEKAKLESEEKRIKFSEDGLPSGCPYKYGYEEDHSCSDLECIDCWNREMPNTEAKEDDLQEIKEAMAETYGEGQYSVWEFMKIWVKVTYMEAMEIFGTNSLRALLNQFTPQEALAKLKAYEESQSKIEVGDVVDIEGDLAVVTLIREGKYFIGLMANGDVYDTQCFEGVKKTGKHLEISSILEQIGE